MKSKLDPFFAEKRPVNNSIFASPILDPAIMFVTGLVILP